MPNVMRSVVGCLIALFAIAVFSSSGISSPSRQDGAPPSINHQILLELMSEYDIPGMAVAVSHRGEDQFGNYGVLDLKSGNAVSQNTLFEIGSVSKLFTATLAAMVEQEGLIALDAPIGKHLPELAETPLGEVAVLHLATHTAGGFPLQLPEYVDTKSALAQYYRDWVPEFPEGARRHYANPSIGLLSLLVARAKGGDFVDLMEQDLFPSMGMHDSFINVPDGELKNYAWGHSRAGERVRVNPAVLADEAYGVKTTSSDLLKFLKLNLDCEGRSAALARAVRQTHVSRFDAGSFQQAMIWEKYGYPIDIDQLKSGNSYKMILEAAPVVEIDPSLESEELYALSKTGSTGGFGAYVLVVPHEQFAIVLLANKNFPIQARIEAAHQIAADFLAATSGHDTTIP